MKEKRIFAFALCIVLSLSLSSCTVSDYVNNLDALETHATTKKSPVYTLGTSTYDTNITTTGTTLFIDGTDFGLTEVIIPKKPKATAVAMKTADSEKLKISDDIISKDVDVSAGIAKNRGKLTLEGITAVSSSKSSDTAESRFFGTSSAFLCMPSSQIDIKDSVITTTGNGASACFAYGTGSVIDISQSEIMTQNANARALASTYHGNIYAAGSKISTNGMNSPAVFVGVNGGTITVTGGEISTLGVSSPAVYSEGTVSMTGVKVKTTSSETAIIEGKNSVSLTGCDIESGSTTFTLYQSNSGETSKGLATLNLVGGTIEAKSGALFYVANTDAKICLQAVEIDSSSSSLVNVVANEKWGEVGENGGKATILANFQNLEGDIYADNLSEVKLELSALSTFEGTINSRNTAKKADIILDGTSKWILTGNSFVSSITPGMADFSNIIDNGYTIYYDADNPTNVYLNGETITLQDGGILTPMKK